MTKSLKDLRSRFLLNTPGTGEPFPFRDRIIKEFAARECGLCQGRRKVVDDPNGPATIRDYIACPLCTPNGPNANSVSPEQLKTLGHMFRLVGHKETRFDSCPACPPHMPRLCMKCSSTTMTVHESTLWARSFCFECDDLQFTDPIVIDAAPPLKVAVKIMAPRNCLCGHSEALNDSGTHGAPRPCFDCASTNGVGNCDDFTLAPLPATIRGRLTDVITVDDPSPIEFINPAEEPKRNPETPCLYCGHTFKNHSMSRGDGCYCSGCTCTHWRSPTPKADQPTASDWLSECMVCKGTGSIKEGPLGPMGSMCTACRGTGEPHSWNCPRCGNLNCQMTQRCFYCPEANPWYAVCGMCSAKAPDLLAKEGPCHLCGGNKFVASSRPFAPSKLVQICRCGHTKALHKFSGSSGHPDCTIGACPCNCFVNAK